MLPHNHGILQTLLQLRHCLYWSVRVVAEWRLVEHIPTILKRRIKYLPWMQKWFCWFRVVICTLEPSTSDRNEG